MELYRMGSRGQEVKKIQQRLKELSYYNGIIDGVFGGNTYAAVKRFQKGKNLGIDGMVGPVTWSALFDNEEIPVPEIYAKPLNYKALALTGSFESSKGIPECFAGLSGDFDGQGISLGVLQWNFGQESLQPLLKEVIEEHRETVQAIFHEKFNQLIEILQYPRKEVLEFARSIQHPVHHSIYEPWKGMFKALCRTEEFQNIQVKYSNRLFAMAIELCNDYSLWSQRAVSLMFDIKTQNGSIKRSARSKIVNDFQGLSKDLAEADREVQRMRIIAIHVAESVKPRWIEDVRSRKMCCAEGGGVVHGIVYDLSKQFGIELKSFTGA